MGMTRQDWKDFTESGVIPQTFPKIVESWINCRKAGLDYSAQPRLSGCAQPPVAEWYKHVKNHAIGLLDTLGANVMIGALLCDACGEVLEIITIYDEVRKQLAAAGIRNNTLLSEKSAGTNAVSICMTNKTRLGCVGTDHYLQKLHCLSGWAAPLFDSDGELNGYIAFYGSAAAVPSRLLLLMTGWFITLHDYSYRLKNIMRIHNTVRKNFNVVFNESQRPMLTVTKTGRLRNINPAALKLLQLTGKQIDEREVDSFARFSPRIKDIVKTANPASNCPLIIRLKQRELTVKFERLPVFSDKDEFLGCQLILDEEKQQRKSIEAFPQAKYTFKDILGKSPTLLLAKEHAALAAETSVNVFLHGPSGTGKEMFAQSIHNASERCDKPFIAINCAAIPRDIAESELFGYAEGAFTGASKRGKSGKLAAADTGTVFLDEIGDMPFELQAKLLRLLEEKTISPVGSSKEVTVDIRVIAASNRDIQELIAAGKFREDLFYRLNVTSINLPSLQESILDVPVLVNHFLTHFNEVMGKEIPDLEPSVMEHFKSYKWPGNIRQLKNAIEFAVMLNTNGDNISWKHLPGELRTALLYQKPQDISPMDPFIKEREEIHNSEKALYEKAILTCRGNMSKAAIFLDISRSTLYRKLKKYNIPVER